MSAESVFGPFVLQRVERRLLRDGKPVTLGSRAFDVLTTLVNRCGELVTKQQIFDAVWPGLFVEENNLQVHISTLRRLLGSDLIVTVPGFGYRFTGRVLSLDAAASQPLVDNDAVARHQPITAKRRTVAVLPFKNLGGDSDQDYFADGLAEDITTHLSKSPWLIVVARNSAFGYRDTELTLTAIGNQLGARYLVHGSVRRSGQRLRMTAELADTETGDSVWVERFDRELSDWFAIQEDMSARIAATVEPMYLRREETTAGKVSPADLQHWDLLLRGRWHFWRSSKGETERAQSALKQALALKPNDAPTLSLMSFTYLSQVWGGWAQSPRDALAEAQRLAVRAIRCDEHDAFAHFTLGTVYSCVRNMTMAIVELERALELQPHFAGAAGELGRLLAFSGRTDEAREYALQAMDLSPHDPHLSLWVRTRAVASFVDGDHDTALRYAMDATAKRPDWFFNHFLLAACAVEAGQMDLARESLERAEGNGPYAEAAMRIGHPFTDEAHLSKLVAAVSRAGWRPK
jgi:TolB-like protein/tetratricopeptide (TPR) repeat protein